MLDLLRSLFSLERWLDGFRGRKKPKIYVSMVLAFTVLSELLSAFTSTVPQVQAITSILVFFWLGLLVFAWLDFPMQRVVQLGSLVAYLELFYQSFFSGGIYASNVSWFQVIVIVNYLIAGRLVGSVWFVLVLFAYVVLYLGLPSWLLDASGPRVAELTTNALSDYSLVAFALVLVLLFFHRQHRNAVTELRARQLELQATQAELEYTLQMREGFISSVSHELRTPMNAILGLNSFLLSAVTGKPRATMVLEHTRQSADHLMTVINDVLDYSQFKSGQLQSRIEKMPLHQTLQTAFDLFKPRIDDSMVQFKLRIDADVPTWVESDRHRLTQILVNLLGNAIKFTHQGEVVLHVSVQSPGLLFTVQDSGIGITPEQQLRLFERFNQADSSIQSRYGGSGLGLTISQRLVQLLGGQMGFESQSAQGSSFWFTLPLKAVTPPADHLRQESTALTTVGQAWTFLVVDDHPVNRLLLRQILHSTWPHAQIHEAEDGHKALAYLTSHSCDLVLMDMVMPGFDGIETTLALHQHHLATGLKSPPVLGLTANVNPHDLQRFQDAGLQSVMLKPFDRDKLCAEIERLLSF